MNVPAENLPKDICMEDINVIYMDMPTGIPEEVHHNPDGSYTVFVNAKYSYSKWVESYVHAIWHIKDNDWQKEDVQEIEYEAHEKEAM